MTAAIPRTLARRFQAWAAHVDVYAVDHGDQLTDAAVELSDLPSFRDADDVTELAMVLMRASEYARGIGGFV